MKKTKSKKTDPKDKLWEQYKDKLSIKELRTMLKSGEMHPTLARTDFPKFNFKGTKFKIGVLSDTHIGSVYFHEEWLKAAFKQFNEEKCDFIVHCGDVTEGLSNRPGHVYECDHIGFDHQKSYSVDLFKKYNTRKIKMFMVDGNHDRWYIKSGGGIIVKDICKELSFAEFLGHDVGTINANGVDIDVWHGEDGSSYATSYRLQKIIEAYTGGYKPHILIAGHVHKYCYIFERHVHAVSAGAMCGQSSFMRGKRLANHAGFNILEVHINDLGVSRFKPEWLPFYG